MSSHKFTVLVILTDMLEGKDPKLLKSRLIAGIVCDTEFRILDTYCVYLQLANIEVSDVCNTANNAYRRYVYCKCVCPKGTHIFQTT